MAASLQILLLITLFASIASASFDATRQPAPHEAIVKRKSHSLKSADGFTINWHVNGKRASVTSHIVATSWIAKSGSIKQSHLTTCGQACDVSTGCAFAQVIQVSKDSSGTVMCALHSSVIPSSKATIKSGPSGSGTVITTYGIQRTTPKRIASHKTTSTKKSTKTTSKKSAKTTSHHKTTSTKHSTKTTTTKHGATTTSKHSTKKTSSHHTTTTKKSTDKSAKTSTSTHKTTSTKKTSTSSTRTSTSATASATANVTAPVFPPSPPGAYFVQFNSCPGLAATVPAFVNNQYNYSTSTAAYIVQHGSARNFNDYFTAAYNVIGNGSLIIAPNNYMTSDPPYPTTWYQPKLNLAWGSTWTSGGDAVAPFRGTTNSLNGGKCSTLDTFDAILNMLDDRSRFPNLVKVYFVSHSGGANLVSKYSQFYNGNHNYAIRYIIANPANQAYFTDSRPYNLTQAAQNNSNNNNNNNNGGNNGSNSTNPSDTPDWLKPDNSTLTSSLPLTSTDSGSSSSSSTSSTNSGSTSSTTTSASSSSSSSSSYPVITSTITSTSTDSSGQTLTTVITSTITESATTTTSSTTPSTSTSTSTSTGTSSSGSGNGNRKRDNPDVSSCAGYNAYPYELDPYTMNRYTLARFDSSQAVFNRWIQRDVVLLVGDMDTDARFPGGGQDCTNQAQGGVNRRDRNYAWWAYQNILAGTGTDVSQYFGYQELIATGAQQWYNGWFNHQICIVDGVGHDQNGMFASQCGSTAMTQPFASGGVGPQYP